MPNEIHDILLLAWIRTATAGLCDVAKQRVDAEIRAHYAEAVAAELAEGRDEDSAHGTALEAFGAATKASEAFQATHLTEYEATILKPVPNLVAGTTRCQWVMEALLVVCFTAIALVFKSVVFGVSMTSALFLPILVNRVYGSWLLRRRRWRQAVVWRWIMSQFSAACVYFALGVWPWLLAWRNGETSGVCVLGVLCAVLLAINASQASLSRGYLSTLRKLRQKVVLEELTVIRDRERNA